MGVMVMPLDIGVSGKLSGKLLISLGGAGASGRSPGVRPLLLPDADFIVIGGGTNTVRTYIFKSINHKAKIN
jgi:hypothetical protein